MPHKWNAQKGEFEKSKSPKKAAASREAALEAENKKLLDQIATYEAKYGKATTV